MILERPAEVEDRAVPGHWKGDLIISQDQGPQIATLVERTTRMVMLVRIPGARTADRVASLLARKMNTLPDFLKNALLLVSASPRALAYPGTRKSNHGGPE